MKILWITGAALALTGCDKPDNAPGPGGVSMGEARALDEAAQMLDARRPPPGLVQPSGSQWPNGRSSGMPSSPATGPVTGETPQPSSEPSQP